MLPKIATLKEYEMKNEYFLDLPKEVISKMKEQLNILDDAYGTDRTCIEKSGGYIQILKSTSEWNAFVAIEQIDESLYEFVERINNEYIYMVYMKW